MQRARVRNPSKNSYAAAGRIGEKERSGRTVQRAAERSIRSVAVPYIPSPVRLYTLQCEPTLTRRHPNPLYSAPIPASHSFAFCRPSKL